ncbi:MAG: molybdopterin-synthase adenylyltransferase MoeB [Alphaproteobacteria bacterium]|nr:molybdopterin-synthase adenylyltransferase MoeB [Alphaproteobacteria bacterium]
MSLSDEQAERYARHLILREIGGAGQRRLLDARVLIIGAGGLGSPALLYLAAAGVGTIGIVDADTVSLSNLQRQIAHGTGDLGRPKVESAARAALNINPDITIEANPVRLDAANAAAIIGRYDIVADGCDNFETRFLINDVCFRLGKTLVSAAVGEFDAQIATYKAHQRAADGGQLYPCYRCLFPHPPEPGTVPTCTEAGVIGALTGVAGSLQALEVIKEITGAGTSLAGRLLLFDGLGMQARTVTLKPDPNCPLCAMPN